MKRRIETVIVAVTFMVASVFFVATANAGNDAPDSEKTSKLVFSGSGHALPVDIINARISLYENLLMDDTLPEITRETAQSLMGDYGKIKTALEGAVSEAYYREITHILFDGVRMLEEKYLKGMTGEENSGAPPLGEGNPGAPVPGGGRPEPPDESSGPGPALPPPMVDGMIAGLEELLAGESLSADDHETATSLLGFYRKIQAALATEVSESYYREITHQLFDGMLLLENGFVVRDRAMPEIEVLDVERNWLKAFNTLDFELMASLYHHAPETVSFSPNSAIRYKGWDVVADGLKKVFDAPPGTYSWTMGDEQVTLLSREVAIIHGTHTVVDRPAEGQEMTGKHLFTRIVQKIDGRWLIVHEHESHIPRAMPPQ